MTSLQKNINLAIILGFGWALSASAQLNESVVVKGEYRKEILYPDKLGHLPQRLRPASAISELPYALNGVEAEFVPSSTAIPASTSGARRVESASRGYMSLSMGSYLNSSLEAGYTALADDNRTLNLWLRHASTSLWHPDKGLYEAAGVKAPCRFSYQEGLGVRWARQFANAGRLEATLSYRLGYFNYYDLIPDFNSSVRSDVAGLPNRVVNDVAAEVGYSSAFALPDNEGDRNKWSVNMGMRHLGFNLATKETHLRLSGRYARMLGQSMISGLAYPSAIGVDAAFDGVFYGCSSWKPAQGVGSVYPSAFNTLLTQNYDYVPSDYANLRISPFYRFNSGNIGLRIGVNADLTFNADAASSATVRPDGHYSLFHISPDVRFDFATHGFAAYIHATGGQDLMTLASIADRNLYCSPYLQSTTPVYVPLDAKIGIRLTPISGLFVEAALGYKLTRNVPCLGWDIPVMNAMYYPGVNVLPGFPSIESGRFATYGLGAQRYNLSGLYVDANVGYKLSGYLDLHTTLQYAPQNEKHGVFNGADRARWLLRPGLTVNPIEALSIGVDYEYRGVRNVWSATTMGHQPMAAPSVGGGTSVGGGNTSLGGVDANSATQYVALRLPDITRLNARAEYNFGRLGVLNNFRIGVEAKNLLNQNEVLLPGLHSEGLTISGQIGFQF